MRDYEWIFRLSIFQRKRGEPFQCPGLQIRDACCGLAFTELTVRCACCWCLRGVGKGHDGGTVATEDEGFWKGRGSLGEIQGRAVADSAKEGREKMLQAE